MGAKSYILAAVLLISWATQAEVGTAEAVEKEVSSLAKRKGIAEKDLGLYATISDGASPQVLINLNGQEAKIPASISKVATASAVLDYFPPGYKFKTQILTKGTVDSKGVLKGSLYLRGGGDPSFVSENMWFLVNSFMRQGIQKIEGDLIVDDSRFDRVRYDESRQKTRVDRAYDAPVGAMSFNWNSVNIYVKPGKKGEQAKVFVDPENDYIRVVNKATTSAGAGNKLLADRKADATFDGDILHVGGSIGEKSKEIVIFKNITQPDLWSGYNLKAFLSRRGVVVTGKIRSGVAPDDAVVAAESESKPVESVVADMNKFSNNYVAEMLIKNIGAAKKAKNVSLADGIMALKEHMGSLGVPTDQYVLDNPSGLTRDNRLSPFAMWKVLQHLRNDFRVQPEFLTSLPIAGVDGTLKKRMNHSPAERWVRAKTGYLNNVVSLAGYAGLSDGRVITFAFIYNGSTDEGKVRDFFDNLLIFLLK